MSTQRLMGYYRVIIKSWQCKMLLGLLDNFHGLFCVDTYILCWATQHCRLFLYPILYIVHTARRGSRGPLQYESFRERYSIPLYSLLSPQFSTISIKYIYINILSFSTVYFILYILYIKIYLFD